MISEDNENRHWGCLWNVQLGIRYHMCLQNAYSRFGKFITAFTLVLSTSAGATIVNANQNLAMVLAFMAALLQTLELVIDTKSKTALHTSLRQRYIQIRMELDGTEHLTLEAESAIKRKISSIEIDEPPVIGAVITKCHNDLNKVYKLDEYNKLTVNEKLLAWWFS